MKKSFYLAMFCFTMLFTVNANAQSKNTTEIVKQDLHQIYGQYFDTYCSKPEQLKFFVDLYKRIEYIPLSKAPSGIKNLSDLDVINKYNPSVIHHDNLTTFEAANFNPLKYFFAYNSHEDLYFKIYGTNMVMKVNKLK